MQRRSPDANHSLQFWNVAELPPSNFRAMFRALAGPYLQSALPSGSWELESLGLRDLRAKICNGKQTLREVYGTPRYGIKTGLNAAFVIDTSTKEQLCAADPNSRELLKPFLEGKDLKRWRAEPRGLWIIYIPKNRIAIDDYPAIRNWLLPFKEKLEKRATKQEWFELQQAQEAYTPCFENPKITYRDISATNPFHLDKSGSYLETTAFALEVADSEVVALLNSKVIWFIFKSLTPLARGGYFRFKAQYIGQLPIPKSTNADKVSLAMLAHKTQAFAEERFKFQRALTHRIPDICPPEREAKLSKRLKGWWLLPDFAAFRAEVKKCFKVDIPLSERTDWEDWITRDKAEIHRLSGEIAKLEADINKQVYALFDLTADEITLLEANI